MDTVKTIKVKPWGEGQGDHVTINESDFNPDFHVLLDGEALSRLTSEMTPDAPAPAPDAPAKAPEDMTVAELHEALDAKHIGYKAKAKHDELVELLKTSEGA